jgi:hypothetical protein
VVNARPRPLYPRERHGTHCIEGWVGASEPDWTGAENLAPPGFDPRTVQSVVSHYTDYAIQAPRDERVFITVFSKLNSSLVCVLSTYINRGADKSLARSRRKKLHSPHFMEH